MMKKLAILIAATAMATMVSLPRAYAAEASVSLQNPQGALKPEPFADVPPDHWAYNAVEELRRAGLVEGYPDRTFKGKRPMTRYEFARFVQLLLAALNARFATIEAGMKGTPPLGGGVTEEQLNELRNMIPTREQIREMINEELANKNFVTSDQLKTVQRLVDEFRDALARLGVDVDAVKKDLADLKGRVEAIEAELARMPKWSGNLNVIGKGSAKSDQVIFLRGAVARPVLDHDGRPMTDDTKILDPVLPYYDLDLRITARPVSDLTVNAVLNAGNYVSSYDPSVLHLYDRAGADSVRPIIANVSVPFHLFGSSDLTVGRQTTQLTPYTFKAVDPDTYTTVPREDSGDVIFFGVGTTWRFGSAARLRMFAGANPLDGRLQPVNSYPAFLPAGVSAAFPGTTGLSTPFGAFGVTAGSVFGLAGGGRAPITQIGNFAGARLSFGEREKPAEAVVTTGPQREVAVEGAATEETTPGAQEPGTTEISSGFDYGPFRNFSLGFNWLYAGAANRLTDPVLGTPLVQDSRAQDLSVDGHTSIGPIRFDGELAFGQSFGNDARPRALTGGAADIRALWKLGSLGIGGGYRHIGNRYMVPGYWGWLGSWKNPTGIKGWIVNGDLPIHWNIFSFLRDLRLRGGAEFYENTANLPVSHMRWNRFEGGVAFKVTDRNPVLLGFEQVYRKYGGAVISLPTGGVAGLPLIGSSIRNTETFVNFGVGHNFTPDVSLQLLYQIVDFAKFTEDNSNQPANYRGYVASAQVGVRF